MDGPNIMLGMCIQTHTPALCGQFQEALLGFSFRQRMWLRGSSNQSWEVLRPWGSTVLILYRDKAVGYAIYVVMIRLPSTCTL